MTALTEERTTTNPTHYWKLRRNRVLRCGICRPHEFENARRSRFALAKSWKKKRRTRWVEKALTAPAGVLG